MKKIFACLLLLLLAANFLSPVQASTDLVKPTSKLYFLQTWAESVKLFFLRSPEQKLSYLLKLTEKRVDETIANPTSIATNRYENHYRQLNSLANQVENRFQASEKIRETSLKQQEVLAIAYQEAPEVAKDAIANAQENSSRHVANTIEAIEGSPKAQEYIQKTALIQQMEKIGQIELLEHIPMETAPNADPSQNTPKSLQESKGLLPGQQLNPINPGLEQGGGGEGKMEPAAPIEMNAPASQN